MRVFLTYIFLFYLFGSTINTHAQSRFSDDLKVEGAVHFGFNVPEYQMFTYITNDYIRSVNISVVKETKGKNEWEKIFNYPEYGLSLFYSSLGNDDAFGRELSLVPFFRTNIIDKENYKLYNQLGVGLSYVSKKFDAQDNYLNVAVGSKLNLHFNLRFGFRYKLSDKIKLNLGVSFDHFSNANTSEPNLGVNYITAYTGLSYRIGRKTARKNTELRPHIKENYYNIVANIGGKYSRALSSKKYITSSVSIEAKRRCYKAFHLGLGLDLFYDSSVKDQLLDAEKEYKSIDSFQTGLHLSQTIVYNRISLTLQEGIYIGFLEKVGGYKVYNRGIVAYTVNKRFSVRLAMKSHLHILDYPEFGFAYKL